MPPLPKRSTERRRRNKVPGETIVQRSGPVKPPALPKGMDVHPVARRWYNSLKQSGQSEYFEPSDWAAAQYVAVAMTKNLETEKFSSMLFASVWSAMDSLLTTEQARRRARLEVERGLQDHETSDETLVALAEYREALGG